MLEPEIVLLTAIMTVMMKEGMMLMLMMLAVVIYMRMVMVILMMSLSCGSVASVHSFRNENRIFGSSYVAE